MTNRIDVYDTVSGERLGYLRMIGKELSLTAPKTSDGDDYKQKKTPHYVENDIEAEKIFNKFLAQRQGGRALRELSYRLG
jgi:hypothetical protein